MGAYAQQKLEHWGGSEALMKFYISFLLPACAIFSIVSITWNATVTGYDVQLYFLLDFILCAFGICALISTATMDGYTYAANLLFLAGHAANKIYRAFAAPLPSDGAAVSVMSESGGIPMDAMSGMMDTMGMDGMGAMAGAAGGDGSGLSLLGQALNSIILKIAPNAGDLTNFLKVLECELFAGACLLMMFYFISHTRFFFTPLKVLRGDD